MRYFIKYSEKRDVSISEKATRATLAAGIGYNTLLSGGTRVLGLRTEQHITPKQNAESIKRTGFLDPLFGGGENGMSAKIKSEAYKRNSKGYVHLSGYINKESTPLERTMHPINKKLSDLMYTYVSFMGEDKGRKKFYTTNSNSFYNNNFIRDMDSGVGGIKGKVKVSVSSNKLKSIIDGIKRTGIKEMATNIKQNPGRLLSGAGILAGGGYATSKLLNWDKD